MIELNVAAWAAWAPGLATREAWQAWARAPTLPLGEDIPALPEMPALQRRRIDLLGRMAIQVACWTADPAGADPPLVFASRHGDVRRSLDLLEQQNAGETMSPTQFGLSVHNAIAALYSIFRGEHGNCVALAAGKATAEAALVEAAGLLADGAPQVQIVVYDAPLPTAYAAHRDEAEAAWAWSLRLQAAPTDTRLQLGWQVATDDHDEAQSTPGLPAGLDALRFLLAGELVRVHCVDGQAWTWRRHG